MKRRCFILGAMFIAVIILTGTAGATAQVAESQKTPLQSGLSVSPAITEHTLKPGETKGFTVTVRNITQLPLPVTTVAKSFSPLEDIAKDLSNKNTFDASAWFKIDEPDFILQPGSTRIVHLTVTAPQTAEPGGHYATIYFKPMIPADALRPETAFLRGEVGVLAFMIVPGRIDENMSLQPVKSKRFQQSGPITFTGKFINEGNVHMLPSGSVTVTDWKGRVAATLPLPPMIVLPSTARSFTMTWDKGKPFGRYTAKAVITYGSATETLSSTTSFWVFPISLVLIVGTSLGIMLFIVLRHADRLRMAARALRGR